MVDPRAVTCSGPALGIDFGATATKAAFVADERVHLVVDRGRSHLASVVVVPPRGDLAVQGDDARARPAPERTITQVKRLLGRTWGDAEVRALDAGVGYRLGPGPDDLAVVRVGDQAFTPVQIVATLLRHVRELAERRLRAPVRDAVLSVPVVTAPGYTPALERAAQLAGLERLRMVYEPVAALWGAHLSGRPGRRVLVCDFGGGTCDCAVLELDGRVRVLGTAGDAYLGGADLDLALADAVAGLVFRATRAELRRDLVAWCELLARCEQAKRRLSTAPHTHLQVPDAWIEAGARHDLEVTLTRDAVDTLWRPLVARAVGVAHEALRVAGVRAELLDDVLLVGGTGQVPAVRAALTRGLGHELAAVAASDVVVAAGLARIGDRARPAPDTLRPPPPREVAW